MKITKTIETKLSQLESIVSFFKSLQEKRENEYSEKSDTWQESEKGQDFEQATGELELLIDDLENAHSYINDFFNED